MRSLEQDGASISDVPVSPEACEQLCPNVSSQASGSNAGARGSEVEAPDDDGRVKRQMMMVE